MATFNCLILGSMWWWLVKVVCFLDILLHQDVILLIAEHQVHYTAELCIVT